MTETCEQAVERGLAARIEQGLGLTSTDLATLDKAAAILTGRPPTKPHRNTAKK